MTVPFWCLLAAMLIPIVLSGVGGYFKSKQFGVLDNHNPRDQGAQLEGAGARTWAAQQNAWEALAIFTGAVVVAHLAGADPGASATAALVFVASRVLHAVFYITDLPPLRSTAFLVGLGCSLWLVGLAARA